MSAPDTDTEKQARQHRGPLTGMFMAVIFAGLLLVGLVVYLFARGGTPEGAAVQVDGRTGEAEATADGAPATDDADASPAMAADPAAVTVTGEVAPDSPADVTNEAAPEPQAGAEVEATADPVGEPDAGGDAEVPADPVGEEASGG